MMICTVALVLAVDVSASISHVHSVLQRKAYVEAFRSPKVVSLLEDHFPVAVSFIEWADRAEYVLNWRVLEETQHIADFAAELEAKPHADVGFQTGVGNAIRFALGALSRTPCDATRKVIDISGDGRNSLGEDPQDARVDAVAANVTINALAIKGVEPDIVQYFQTYVVTPRGFVVEAQGFHDFQQALERKLRLEIAVR